MVQEKAILHKYSVIFESALVSILLIRCASSEPRNVAIIQDIDTVSIEKGVDIISTKTEKSNYEHSKESHELIPKLQQEYSEGSAERTSLADENFDETSI